MQILRRGNQERGHHQPSAERHGLALCLSGGGYRAALFHLGALRRLNELGVLSRVDTISTVSGGSIVAALLRSQVDPWPRPGEVIVDRHWDECFARRLRELTRKNIRTLWFFERLLPWNWFDSTVAVRALARRYRKEIKDGALTTLPAKPRYVFCATDMSFGVNWICERQRIGDYQAGYLSPPPAEWTVSRAVAASSCFPPVFDPLPIALAPDQLKNGKAYKRGDREDLIKRLRLSDGGVYDNMGLEPVWKDSATVLVSDGGGTVDFAPDRGVFRRLGRYLTVQSNQAGAVRKRWLIANFENKTMTGTYWGIGSPLSHYERDDGYSKELVEELISEVRTDLDCFSRAEQAVLENHGYLLADAAIQRHLPDLAKTGVDLAVPHPDYLDEAKVRRELADSPKRRLLGRWRWGPGT